MKSSDDLSFAIIGASITGLSLALSLLQHSICDSKNLKVYDQRAANVPDAANSSGIVLTPNGLSILDSLNVLERIRDVCWLSEYRTYKNDQDETTRKTLITNEALYGYKNHRVWRRVLISTLLEMVVEKGVEIVWEAKFGGIISESGEGISFLVNGIERSANVLIGADGIHSAVRKYVDPHGCAEYTGVMGVLSHIRWEEVEWPYDDYERACTIQGAPGALIMIPENREGSIVMVARQKQMKDIGRENWEELAQDKESMFQVFKEGYEGWGKTARGIIDAVGRNSDTLYLWPFMRMAKLKSWFSPTGRVVIMGDAAHALPPSSGQGVNQTLEDIYAFTRLFKCDTDRVTALEFWQSMRQERIDAVFDWATNTTNVQRLPQAERDRLVREGKAQDASVVEHFDDMRWLYQQDIDAKINAWMQSLQQERQTSESAEKDLFNASREQNIDSRPSVNSSD